jgi:Flp pilus assembly protein TadG
MRSSKPYTCQRRRQHRRGAAATEFVVLLPLLIVLCLTSVDFGRFAYAYLALGNAGRTAAEVGATQSYSVGSQLAWRQQVEAALREDFSTTGGLDPDKLVMDANVEPDASGLDYITVTATYPYATLVFWPGIPQPLDMTRSVTFRRFR